MIRRRLASLAIVGGGTKTERKDARIIVGRRQSLSRSSSRSSSCDEDHDEDHDEDYDEDYDEEPPPPTPPFCRVVGGMFQPIAAGRGSG